jgi:hypothetical protein
MVSVPLTLSALVVMVGIPMPLLYSSNRAELINFVF